MHAQNRPARASAEDFLRSVSALFNEGGAIYSRMVAEAAADPTTKGYETLEKAKHTVAQTSVDIYVAIAVMVGRHLCGKLQDENFGKTKADNLDDIAARLRTLVRGAFPTLGDDKLLDTIVLPRIVLPQIPAKGVGKATAMARPQMHGKGFGPGSLPLVPKKEASAASSAGASAGSSAPEMPIMSTINSQGERVGAIDRLNHSGMAVGGTVTHRTLKGVYKLEGLDLASGGGPTVTLSLLFKCSSMQQLWATLPARRAREDQGQHSDTDAAAEPEGTHTAEAERAASGAVGAGALLPQDIATCTFSKAAAAKPPPSLAPPATCVIDSVPERASAGADSGTPTAGSDEQPKSVVEFEQTKVVNLEDLLQEWKAESGHVEHSFNEEWPGSRLTCNEKHLKNLATGLCLHSSGYVEWQNRPRHFARQLPATTQEAVRGLLRVTR